MLVDLGRAEEAIDYLRQAQDAFAEIDYRRRGVRPAHPGPLLPVAGPGRGGPRLPARALASHRATGNRRRQAATLRSLGTAQSRAGLTAEARESWTQATAIFNELGDIAEAEEVRAEQAASGIS